MTLSSYLLTFSSGLFVGMLVLYAARKISAGEGFGLFGGIGRLVALVAEVVRRAPDQGDSGEAPVPAASDVSIDCREQNIYDSAQTIRNILLVLTASIQRTDKAASDSSLLLGGVKSAITTRRIPTDLSEAQTLLMREIDRVISSNAALKYELSKSQAVLTEQQQQIDHLRTAVRIDGLTQLANRAYFDEKLNELITVHKRYGDPFSVMMIDLDNFKSINDSFGHLAGDRILKGVSLKIKASLRGSDFLARFGGDEYAIILLRTDAAAATEVAWKLCEEVRGSRFILDDKALAVTLSIGVAEVTGGDTDESLLKRADQALYRVKAAGRNGVSSSEAP